MSIDGRKTSCDHNTTARELDEITLINMPSPAWAKAASRKNRIKPNQLTGDGASKRRGAVAVIIEATITMCSMVVNAGMVRIEIDGTPFIL
jgi:hypothetical protein